MLIWPGLTYDKEQQVELFISLTEREGESTEASKVTKEFVNSKYFHDLQHPHHLSRLPDQFVLLQLLQHQRGVEREKGQQVCRASRYTLHGS